MSDKPTSKSRRDAIKMMMGGLAAVPLMNLVGMAAAQADDLPHVDEASDAAKGFKYVHDAAASERESVARPGKPAAEQNCANCALLQPGEGDWLVCPLFPGQLVSVNGWCNQWTLKPGA